MSGARRRYAIDKRESREGGYDRYLTKVTKAKSLSIGVVAHVFALTDQLAALLVGDLALADSLNRSAVELSVVLDQHVVGRLYTMHQSRNMSMSKEGQKTKWKSAYREGLDHHRNSKERAVLVKSVHRSAHDPGVGYSTNNQPTNHGPMN